MQVRHSKALSPFKERDENFLMYNQKSSLSERTWTQYGSQVRVSDPAFHTKSYQCWYELSTRALRGHATPSLADKEFGLQLPLLD